MASCARNLVQRSSNSAKSLLFRAQSSHSISAGAPKLSGLAPTLPRPSSRRSPFFSTSRLPVELGCGESLMPLHSATASALLNSMLSAKVGRWGILSEGEKWPYRTFATKPAKMKFCLAKAINSLHTHDRYNLFDGS
ncbi:nuclear fusion defective 6 [Perilla frutescens var. frutescens]|nr:nuclear fusion defective 6 [Perilla frutescens var. frutescens]